MTSSAVAVAAIYTSFRKYVNEHDMYGKCMKEEKEGNDRIKTVAVAAASRNKQEHGGGLTD